MRRREFITLLGGAAAAWPVTARAQQATGRMRLVGILQNLPENDPVGSDYNAAFHKELQQSGWTIGDNIRIDIRWAGTKSDDIRRHAAELVALYTRCKLWPTAPRPWGRCSGFPHYPNRVRASN